MCTPAVCVCGCFCLHARYRACICTWLFVWEELAGARACEIVSVCCVLHAFLSQESSLVRLSRLIYGPAGGACHDFLNLKSQPHPLRSYSTVAAGRDLLQHLQLCEDMCAVTLSLQHFLRVCFQSASNVCHVYTCWLLHVLSLYLCKSVERVCVCVFVWVCVSLEVDIFSPLCQLVFWHV